MIIKPKILVLTLFAVINLAPAHAAGSSYAVIGNAAPPPPDPIGDSIRTSAFDPARPVDPLDRSAADADKRGLSDGGDRNSFALKPAPASQFSQSNAVEPPSTRLGSRMGRRLSARIDNHGGSTPSSGDPRDRIGADPGSRVDAIQNAYNSNR